MLCLVTDRRRLAGAGSSIDEATSCLERQTRFAAEAGVDLVQVRERDLEAAVLASLVRRLLAITHGTRTRLVVNDRLDVALACGADGVHLRGDSYRTAEARRLAPARFLIGRSVHSVPDARAAADADYVIAGTLFPSASKGMSRDVIGVDGLRAIAACTHVPVLGIGGITAANLSAVAATGAAGCAAIGLFIGEGASGADGECRAAPLREIVNGARRLFDTVKTHP